MMTNDGIRQAMLRHERTLFSMVRKANQQKELFTPQFLMSRVAWNALRRLEAKGRIVGRRHRGWFGYAVKGVRIGRVER